MVVVNLRITEHRKRRIRDQSRSTKARLTGLYRKTQFIGNVEVEVE